MKNLNSKKTNELIRAILALKSDKDAKAFLRDLLTEGEIIEFGNRWKAAKMLSEKISYPKIQKETGLSTRTIARISDWLKNGKGGYRLMIKKMSIHNQNPSCNRKKFFKKKKKEAAMKRIVVVADEARLFFESCLQYGSTLAKMYCDVWREPPWNEDFWKEDEVLAELVAQNSKKTAIGCYAIFESEDYEKIVGFTLGYEVGKEEMQSISSCNKLDYLFKDNQKGFYIDELAVQGDFRNLGIASSLCKDLIQKAGNSGVDLFILRTDEKAEPAREVYRNLGFRDTFIRDGKHPTRTYLVKFL